MSKASHTLRAVKILSLHWMSGTSNAIVMVAFGGLSKYIGKLAVKLQRFY